MPRIANTASDAMVTLTSIMGSSVGLPGKTAKIVKLPISTTNRKETDLAIPILSETNPAISAATGFSHIFATLIAAPIVTVSPKMSVAYDVNRNVPQ